MSLAVDSAMEQIEEMGLSEVNIEELVRRLTSSREIPGVSAGVKQTESGLAYIEAEFHGLGVGIVKGTTGTQIVTIYPLTEDKEIVVKLVTGTDEVTTLRFNEA